MNFEDVFLKYNWEEISQKIYNTTSLEVEQTLGKSKMDLSDFLALISPAAETYLEVMAQKSHIFTTQRFGFTMGIFAPMYLSNECQNICTYCGFSQDNPIRRRTLTPSEMIREAEVLKTKNIDHVLLVTGEANKTVGVNYLLEAVKTLKPYFSQISIEVQPLETHEYEALKEAGVHGVLVYQESYHRETYKNWHPKGKKSNFSYRLDTPDRIGKAGLFKMGIGALLGLEDWRVESFFLALHLQYLEKTYWKTRYSISFPRLRPAEGVTLHTFPMSDKQLIQLVCAFRLFSGEVELTLSTRESEKFRDHGFKLGFTSMSAESKTNPGGYAVEKESLEQFEISDERSVEEICGLLKKSGYEPVFKDWEHLD